MPEIPRWKVQAALHLLGIDDPGEEIREVSIRPNTYGPEIVLNFGGIWPEQRWSITDAVQDIRMHVLGIDPEDGNAVLTVCPDNDVKFYAGANMYLDGSTVHANGTMMPVFKRRP
jgi:hypothetical protein